MVTVSAYSGKPYQPVFRDYFLHKISEGKTKPDNIVKAYRKLSFRIGGDARFGLSQKTRQDRLTEGQNKPRN
jgi:hypothetical protein